jgi:hypothetical protein
MFVLSTQATNRDNDNEILTVEGKFMAQKNVNYKVFEYQENGSLKEVFSGKGSQYFAVTLTTGNHYVVNFTALNNEVKSLFIDADESGTFQLIVDFTKPNAGVLTYNSKKSVYELKSIPITKSNEERKSHRD